jgi:fructosamine-3-kinase
VHSPIRLLPSGLRRLVAGVEPVAGGDICKAYRLRLRGGGSLFMKTHSSAPMLAAEAKGLQWLAEAEALAVPAVRGVCSDGDAEGYLVLEWVQEGGGAASDWEGMGRGLARLHRSGAGRFGMPFGGHLGSLALDNSPCLEWTVFYSERRLLPQARLAVESGRAGSGLLVSMDRLVSRLDGLVGDPETPARIHGDLWSGNCIFSENGRPYLVDPSPCTAHREMDIAMMKLFGGFPARCFGAYLEEHPLQPGWEDRLPLYQLFYLLAHVNLHGPGWMRSVRRVLDFLA